jgi:hypothetical protein
VPVDFGQWLPDQPSLNNPGAKALINGFPTTRGFSAVPSATATTAPEQVAGGTTTAIPEILGIYSTVEVTGADIEARTYIGTSSRLLKYDTLQSKFAEFTSSDPTYTNIPRWQFVEFATTGGTRYVYAAGGSSVTLQRFPSDGTAAPAAVSAVSSGTATPNATHLAVVGRFLVCGNTSNSEAEVRWSQIDDADSWTIGSNQADAQIIADASEVTGLVGGETGLVLTREGLLRMQYVGAPLVFTFDKVSNLGCDFPGSVAARSADEVYYLSEDGFHRYAGGQVANIGAQRVNDFFFSDFDRDAASRIACTIDPVRSLVVWSYGSKSADTDTNDTLLVFDYTLDRWGMARIDHTTVGVTRQVGRTLESLDTDASATIFARDGTEVQDRAGNTVLTRGGGIDSLTISFDSAAYQGGQSILALAQDTTDGTVLSTLSGTPLPLTVQTGEFEPVETRHAMLRSVFPHIDGAADAEIRAQVSARTRQVDSQIFGQVATVNSANIIPLRKAGRYMALKFLASGNWSEAHGFSFDATAQGRR